ncbi:hypothetical protein GH714_029051 [Hevea brasiliensis]|uniref:Glycoside hydrolase family 5 domain-containing protein n=1 Tax=Hevea brasiliensis TaxID=3981 RepID=A0A6A6KZB7_HEVBR|nr:hypothetical protein GH714_029051 [Hevea brasiliensis]
MGKLSFFSVLSILSLSITLSTVTPPKQAAALPLSTSSRWIVDENGKRVKLACVNWVSHLEVVVAEGLSKQPMDEIAKKIVSMGFNCVRLTWPIFLVTNDTYASLTVRQSFQGFGLLESISGIQANNPSIIDLPLIKAYQAVVSSLGNNNVMVILDNHIGKPGWCCSNFDDNGFFGDTYFNPDQWIKGLTQMATIFNGFPNVVGMSLRNELRGQKQNVNDWYRYMEKGAEAVHSANPDVLVILSGLSYGTDLSFLRNRPVNLTFTGKVVFEVRWYVVSYGQAWKNGNPNQLCGRVMSNMRRVSWFLLDQGWPLFVSEFGLDQRGTNVNDNRYLGCFLGVEAELDLDWALRTLVGICYLRGGVLGFDEVYGVLNWNWCDIRIQASCNKYLSSNLLFKGGDKVDSKTVKEIPCYVSVQSSEAIEYFVKSLKIKESMDNVLLLAHIRFKIIHPPFAFLMAWALRLEKVNLRKLHSQAKTLGTLLTVAIKLKTYPVELSLTALICLMATIEGSIFAVIVERGNRLVYKL